MEIGAFAQIHLQGGIIQRAEIKQNFPERDFGLLPLGFFCDAFIQSVAPVLYNDLHKKWGEFTNPVSHPLQ